MSNTNTKRIRHATATRSGEPLKVGDTIRVPLERIHRDSDGNKLCSDLVGSAPGTVVEVGAHWSDSPHGRAGWHYLNEA